MSCAMSRYSMHIFYVDAARNAILVRGCRRMDPENLMKRDPKSHAADASYATGKFLSGLSKNSSMKT